MNRAQIEDTIRTLAKSQGFYSRLWVAMVTMKENDPDLYDWTMAELEEQNFKDAVELIMYFEG